MKLKHAHGWFAAGPEMARAMTLLSDGAFKLFVYLCLQADRETARLAVNDRDLTVGLQKSRRSIVSYLDELETARGLPDRIRPQSASSRTDRNLRRLLALPQDGDSSGLCRSGRLRPADP